MPRVLKVLAVLFFILAAAATYEGIATVLKYREGRFAGPEITQAQFFSVARNLAFTWLFAGIYAAAGLGLWQRRRFHLVVILLLATLVGQWMNVGFPNGFILSFLALAVLAVPAVRTSFRN